MEGFHQYKCDKCQLKFDCLELLKVHQNPTARISCALCCSGFNNESAYHQHLGTCHNTVYNETDKTFKCSICFKKFSNKYYLITHMLIHSGERPYKCEKCNLTFRQQVHLNQHKSQVGKKLQCSLCCSSFDNKRFFALHNNRIHNKQSNAIVQSSVEPPKMHVKRTCRPKEKVPINNKPKIRNYALHECQKCGLKFKRFDHLIAHQTRIGKPFQCQNCCVSYDSENLLKTHCKHVHDKKRNTFIARKKTLKKSIHYKVNSNCTNTRKKRGRPGIYTNLYEKLDFPGNTVRCKLCRSIFRHNMIYLHIVTVHENERAKVLLLTRKNKAQIKKPTLYKADDTKKLDSKFDHNQLKKGKKQSEYTDFYENYPKNRVRCKLCSKVVSRSNMKPHIDCVHRNVRPYACSICVQQFKRKDHLERHVARVHLYQCKFCSTQWNSKNDLQEHIVSVHNPTAYKCNICFRNFKYKRNLKRHFQTVHKNQSDETKIVKVNVQVKDENKFDNLSKHAYNNEFIAYPLKCRKCFRRYKSEYHLKRHVEMVHSMRLTTSSKETTHSDEPITTHSENLMRNSLGDMFSLHRTKLASNTDLDSKSMDYKNLPTNSFNIVYRLEESAAHVAKTESLATAFVSKTNCSEEVATKCSDTTCFEKPVAISPVSDLCFANTSKKENIELIVISDDEEEEDTEMCVSCDKYFPLYHLKNSFCTECSEIFIKFKAFIRSIANE